MTQQYHHHMNNYWSELDYLWLVEVPEMLGAMAYGTTPEEVVAHDQEVVENWVEVARMDGRPIPDPKQYDVPTSV